MSGGSVVQTVRNFVDTLSAQIAMVRSIYGPVLEQHKIDIKPAIVKISEDDNSIIFGYRIIFDSVETANIVWEQIKQAYGGAEK